MKIDFNLLKKSLIAVNSDLINHTELNYLIKISRLIIQSYLINYRSNVFNLIYRIGINLNDLSYDCIADAFCRVKDEKYFYLRKFISSLGNNINDIDNKQLYFSYKNFLIKITNTQLAKLYSQSDPIGAKILRNIKDTIKHHNGFYLNQKLGGLNLTFAEGHNTDDPPNYYPIDLLLSNFHISGNGYTIKQLLDNLKQILTDQNEYSKSIL